MKLKNRLWLISALLIGISVNCVFISCSSDDEDDSKKLTSSERQLLGGWSGAGIGMVLQTGGKMYYDGFYDKQAETGSWQYNETTGILATDATDKYHNTLQWQITMISNNSWSGLALWNNNKTVSAERDAETAVRLLLTGTLWNTKEGNTVKYKYEKISDNNKFVSTYINGKNEGKTIFFDKISEDIENDAITIQSYSDIYTIYHPYNSKDIYFKYPSGLQYYPEK